MREGVIQSPEVQTQDNQQDEWPVYHEYETDYPSPVMDVEGDGGTLMTVNS